MPDYASLVQTIDALAEFRHAAAFDSEPWKRLADQEKALRADLATTPEHQQAQAAWRKRSEAAARARPMRRHVLRLVHTITLGDDGSAA